MFVYFILVFFINIEIILKQKPVSKDYGFSISNVNHINQYFDEQVYLNIISTEKGYYSPNQAEIIITEFMDYFNVDEFKFITSKRYNTYAFVNGKYSYRLGNGKRTLDVTISLKYLNNKWYLDQININ